MVTVVVAGTVVTVVAAAGAVRALSNSCEAPACCKATTWSGVRFSTSPDELTMFRIAESGTLLLTSCTRSLKSSALATETTSVNKEASNADLVIFLIVFLL